uniref:heme/hemin ABC transporter substrate-binding protein n=1 Tax=Thaumasiovibrio occultus TaxID=1891184 RepID=UPI000B3556B5|nr:ABC transporter substrate-binding protein [Thaumasiovibrio occultus]
MKKSILTTALMLSLSFGASAQADNKEPRIISAGSTVTELVYALGAEDTLVAVDLTSRHFVEGTDIPQVGYHRQLSAEGLMALAPDMLIGSSEMGPETTISTLTNAGVDIEIVTTGIDRADLNTRIDQVAKLTGSEANAPALKDKVNARLDVLENQTLDNAPSVIFVMMAEGRPMTVAGKNTPVEAVIELAGAVNPTAEQFESYKPMSLEAILELQPDYILVSERNWDSMGGFDGILEKMPLLAATPAGQNHNLIKIPGTAIIGGFGLQSLELAETLHNTFQAGSAQ